MNTRGQSALEYLMTYGWALIVIAIVIGVLIFVTSGSTGGITCQSLATQMQLTEWTGSPGVNGLGLTFRNATAGPIDTEVSADCAAGTVCTYTGSVTDADGDAAISPDNTAVAVGSTWTVTNLDLPAATTGQVDGTVTVGYTTAGGLPATVAVRCTGSV